MPKGKLIPEVIKVHPYEDRVSAEAVWIRVDTVREVASMKNERYTEVQTIEGHHNVKETPEQVLKMLGWVV